MAVEFLRTAVGNSGCAETAAPDSSSTTHYTVSPMSLNYTAFILPGNGACLFESCLQARPVWKVHMRGVDEQSAWNLWWGSNGQACPFKRLRTGVVVIFPYRPDDQLLMYNKTIHLFWVLREWFGHGSGDGMRRMVSRIPQIREVATKARLSFHVARYQRMLCLPGCALIPETHVVSSKLQLGNETQRLHDAAQNAITDGRGRLWIVKPESRNRGIGITVHRSMRVLLHTGLGLAVHVLAECLR